MILILSTLCMPCFPIAFLHATEQGAVTPADAWEAGWPNYRGPRGDYAALDIGVKILADPSRASFLWKSEAHNMPRGKAWSSTDAGSGAAGHPGGGGCSPIIAFGCVYQFYTRPAGDVWYDVPRGRKFAKELFRVEGDDVVHCVDLATGKTRWIRTFPRRSLNGQSMKSCIPDNNTPCIAGETLVFLGPSWRLCGIDARSGEWRWERPATPRRAAGPPTNDELPLGCHWKSSLPKQALTPMHRSDERELLKLRSLLKRTGTIAGHNLGLAYLMPVGEKLVLLNDQSGGVHAINVADGTTRWRIGGGKNEPQVSRWHQPAVWSCGRKPLLLLSTTEGIHCIDPADGSELWRLDGVRPHGHLVVMGDRLVALGGRQPLNPDANLLSHRGGALGHPVCWELTADGAKQAWQRNDLITDGSKWAYRLDEQHVAVLHWTHERTDDRKQAKEIELRVLDIATGKGCAEPVSALGLLSSNATRNGYGIAAGGVVIFENDMSHAHHDFFSIRPLNTGAAFSAIWKPPHPTTTAYDSYMVKPMIAGRRVMRGALGLLCYDWRERPTDDGLFVAPEPPDWAQTLPEKFRNLTHPLQSVRDRAAAEAAWRDDNRRAVELILEQGERPAYEALAGAVDSWARDAAVLTHPLADRVQALVKSGRGDSAAALARAVRSLDAPAACRLAIQLAPELAADQPARARAACEAIGRLGPGLEPVVVAALVTALKRDDVVAQYAARAIARSSTVETEALAALVAGIQSPDARLSVACSQSLRALLVRNDEDAKLQDRVADLLPAPDADTPRLPQLGLARVAEQLGPAGRDYLIALGEVCGDEEAIVAALTFSFPNDATATAYVTKAVEAADGVPRKRLEAVLSRAREKLGGDLPELRISEALRY
jgi:outer membrane protein assembly factor BamB